PSLPPLPATDEAQDREFYCIAAPLARRVVREDDKKPPPDEELFSFHYDLTTGVPRIDRPGFVEALRLMQKLQAFRPVEPARQPAEAFRDGRAVLCLAGSEWVGRFQEEGSPVRGRFGICRTPGSRHVFPYQTGAAVALAEVNHVPYLGAGGWLAVVPRGTAHPEAAFALLTELSGPQTSAEIALGTIGGGGTFRHTHLTLFAKGNAFELDMRGTQALVENLRLTLSPA